MFAISLLASTTLLADPNYAGNAQDLQFRDVEVDGEVWSELIFSGRGLIIKSSNGKTLLTVDHFGGIYLDGVVYVNRSEFPKRDDIAKLESSSAYVGRGIILSVSLSAFISVLVGLIMRSK